MGEGGSIDVSGGGRLTAGGAVIAGRAGSVSLSTTTGDAAAPTTLTLGKTLKGYGLSSGGSLNLVANAICISTQHCSTASNQLELTPEWFTSGGFGRISLASSIGALELMGDATLNLQQQNFILNESALTARTGAAMTDVASIGLLPDAQRKAMNLSLTAAFQPTEFAFADRCSTVARASSLTPWRRST